MQPCELYRDDNGIGIKVYKVFMVHSGGKSFTVSFKDKLHILPS